MKHKAKRNASQDYIRPFKVYFGPKKFYFTVVLFKTIGEMHVFVRELRRLGMITTRPRNFGGLTATYTKKQKDLKHIGFITMCEPYSKRSGVVAHEMFHATLYYWWWTRARDLRLLRDKKAEERFAHLIGNAVAQYWRNWWRRYEERRG